MGVACLREGEPPNWLKSNQAAIRRKVSMIKSPLVQQQLLVLVDGSRPIGAIQIQNRGTIGGNIVNTLPAGNSLPGLATFDAKVEVCVHMTQAAWISIISIPTTGTQ